MSEPLPAAPTVSDAGPGALDRYQRHLFHCAPPLYREPLVLRSGRGCWVRDAAGRDYLDLFAGILTTSVGHCHPEVAAAVTEQMSQLGHVSTLYLTERQGEMAELLAAIAPGDLDRTFFTNSGTEAIETAVMLACQHTGRTEVLALRHGYSGRSVLATNLTAHAPWRPLTSLLAGVKHVRSPYPYRCPLGHHAEPCGERCVDVLAADLEEAIATTTGGGPAALLVETIQGVGGYIVPPPGYFQRVAEIVRAHGGLLIVDEVQTGFGRTGDHWFGISHWDTEPDIMVMAKGIANGFPVGATTTRGEIAESWKAKTISTFGGNPVAMAAALATQRALAEAEAPARSAALGGRLRDGLDALAERHEWIGEVRGMGLMQALELVRDRESREPDSARAAALLEATREEGLLVGVGGLWGSVVRMGPSLLIDEDEIDEALARLGRACDRVD